MREGEKEGEGGREREEGQKEKGRRERRGGRGKRGRGRGIKKEGGKQKKGVFLQQMVESMSYEYMVNITDLVTYHVYPQSSENKFHSSSPIYTSLPHEQMYTYTHYTQNICLHLLEFTN